MIIKVTNVTGFYEAFVSMFISKRTWTPELDKKIEKICDSILDNHGRFKPDTNIKDIEQFNKWLDILLKMGKRHITILRFIDITIMTESIHRAGQDDVDAHAMRFNNRIIRSSTRLATFNEGEKSSYYEDKIITDGEMCELLDIGLPKEIKIDGKDYVKSANGYVLKEYENNKDVMRGLYMLSIPSNFISKINLCEWAHVFKERNENGGANPEVKEWAEDVMHQITCFHEQITRDYILSVQN